MKYAYIEIANACNLNCSFCPYSQKTHSPSWMSVELFSKIIDDIKNHVEEIYLHVLGEPLLHPNLNIFLEIAKKAHLCVNITTNGTLIKKNHQLLLESTVVRQINFSVHALEEWNNQEKALSALNDMLLFAQEATERRPDLYINFRLWNIQKENSSHWNRLISSQLESTFHCDLSTHDFSIRHKSFPLQNRIYLHFDTRFEWPEGKSTGLSTKGTCKALDSHIGILCDGRVVACCLDHNGNLELGKLPQQTLSSILSSPRAVAMKLGFKEKKLVEPFCQSCGFCKRFKV